MAKKDAYNADSITVLEGLEAVRKRPGMYIGGVSVSGLNHLVYEIVDNAVDEHLAGFCNHIEVTLENDGSVTVRTVAVVFLLIVTSLVYLQSVLFLRRCMQEVNLITQHIKQAEDFMV